VDSSASARCCISKACSEPLRAGAGEPALAAATITRMRASDLSTTGVRVVAAFEAAKGAVVLAAGFGVLSAVHKDLAGIVETLVRHLHLNPAKGTPRVFVDLARNSSSAQLWLLAAAAFAYAALRLAEAYGLWTKRRWAEWFAVLSGAIYVPFEIYEIAQGFSPLKLTTLLVNVGIVLFMAYALRASRQRAGAAISTGSTPSASSKPNTLA
jgi:uncharacterized membrane protein (DUF2068 family)